MKKLAFLVLLIPVFSYAECINHPVMATEDCWYTLTIVCDPPDAGIIEVTKTWEAYNRYIEGEYFIVEIFENDGFVFSHWNDNLENTEMMYSTRKEPYDETITAHLVPEVVPAAAHDSGSDSGCFIGVTM